MAEIQKDSFKNKVDKFISQLRQPEIDPLSALQMALEDWGDRKDLRPELTLNKISELETLALVNKLGNNTSYGNDELNAMAIKLAAGILYKPITYVINLSIESSTFVQKWKIGHLLPLHKGKGLNSQDPDSYRPILLLPVLGKLTEQALQQQFLIFMKISNQMNKNHHSYRVGHSTTTAMLQISDQIF